MKRDSINYFIVGLFVLTLLVGFFVVLYKITGRTGPTDKYYVYYENVTGIKFGTPVLYEGYQIGQVEEIVPEREQGDTRYKLTLSVTKDWQIPSDSVAAILKSGLLSAISINIEEGESTNVLQSGAVIEGRAAADIFAAVNDVAAEIQDLSRDSIRPLFTNLNQRIDELANELTTLTRDDLRPMIEKMSKQFDQPELINNLRELSDKLNSGADNLLSMINQDNVDNVNQILVNLKGASDTFNDLLARIDNTRVQLDNLFIHMDDLVAGVDDVVNENSENIKASIQDLKTSLDVVSQHIDAVTYHLEGTTRNMHEFTRQIKENPALLIKGSPQAEKEN